MRVSRAIDGFRYENVPTALIWLFGHEQEGPNGALGIPISNGKNSLARLRSNSNSAGPFRRGSPSNGHSVDGDMLCA